MGESSKVDKRIDIDRTNNTKADEGRKASI